MTTVNICTDSRFAELEQVHVEPNSEHSQHLYNLGSHEHGLATVWMQCETQCGYVFLAKHVFTVWFMSTIPYNHTQSAGFT